MEIQNVFTSQAAAEAALNSMTAKPGTMVRWDLGTTSMNPARPRDWPALLVSITIVLYSRSVYTIIANVLTPEKRLRRYNARCLR
jgi:hypothetical protein